MSINITENLTKQAGAANNSKPQPSPEALRQAAAQFEALLLTQLTSSLNGTSGDDEDSLFGNDGGSNLAKQMFSEQLATTMANAGGIGLSDVILRQFGIDNGKPSANPQKIAGAISEIRNPEQPMGSEPGERINLNTPKNEVNLSARTTAAIDAPMLTSEKSEYLMPVMGKVSSDFGVRFHPVDKKTKFHPGLDLAAPKGTPIGAANEGVVTFAGWSNGYGNLVIIKHPDGRETRYGHASKLLVGEGDKVSAGQTIALVGSTGKSTGPHLHFEVRENGDPIDPAKFLSNVLPRKSDK